MLPELQEGMKVIVGLVSTVAFPFGVVKFMNGWSQVKQGENGYMDMIGGGGMALSPAIAYGMYKAVGLGGVAVDPGILAMIIMS